MKGRKNQSKRERHRHHERLCPTVVTWKAIYCLALLRPSRSFSLNAGQNGHLKRFPGNNGLNNGIKTHQSSSCCFLAREGFSDHFYDEADALLSFMDMYNDEQHLDHIMRTKERR